MNNCSFRSDSIGQFRCALESNSFDCSLYEKWLPSIYMYCSIPSAIACVLVIIIYFSLRRLTGYLPKVLYYRTLLDLSIALIHIVSRIADAAKNNNPGCRALGALLQFFLFASSGWYIALAINLFFSIRNPFSLGSKLHLRYHFLVWTPSVITVIILVATGNCADNAGRSMFYYCWVSVEDWDKFARFSWGLLIAPQFASFIISIAVLLFAMVALWRRLPTSGKTRAHLLKQNSWYVLAITFETMAIGGIWVIEFARNERNTCFCNKASFGLAVAFAVIHSLRGVFDCIIWFYVLSVGPKDFRYMFNRFCNRCKKRSWDTPSSLETPLLFREATVDQSLRKGVILCINHGILDIINKAICKEEDDNQRIGDAPNRIVAAIMLEHADAEEDQNIEDSLFEKSIELSTRMVKFTTSSKDNKFTFVSMEPTIFRLLWKSQQLNFQTFKQSFILDDMTSIDSSGMLEKFTEGKSGSFFYFTHDYRYIIKTVSSEEEKVLRKFVRAYYRHMKANPESLIVRFYGLYQVQLAWEQKYISVVVMENIFHSTEHFKIHEKYDLKGSWVGRRVLKGNDVVTGSSTLKDLDLQKQIYVGQDSKVRLIEQLQKDTAFLAANGIMDYSLLLGIHDHRKDGDYRALTGSFAGNGFEVVSRSSPSSLISHHGSTDSLILSREETFIPTEIKPWFRQDYGGLRSYTPHHPISAREENYFPTTYDGSSFDELPIATYYIGVVDILQKYNLKKRSERFWKAAICQMDPLGISVTNPDEYQDRFINFISTKLA